jgi:hypothetical protein
VAACIRPPAFSAAASAASLFGQFDTRRWILNY